MQRILLWAGALLLVTLAGGCCSSDQCLNSHSGQDGIRTSALRIKTKLVYNDQVNAPKRDRTDWRYVMLSQPGKLSVLLHWDSGDSKLELDVFDVMGVKIQQGRVWGSGGVRAVVAVEEPGPYYIRVRAAGTGDKSHYSLRTLFEPDLSKVKVVCHDCKVGERKCLGETGYILCEQLNPGCAQWTKTFACPGNQTCQDGFCDPCANPCQEGARRCADKDSFALCRTSPGARCASWGQSQSCPAGQRCKSGGCVKLRGGGRVTPRPDPPKPPPQAAAFGRCKIISIYRYRGEWTLHLECPENVQVQPGVTGNVLDGNSTTNLAGGEVKVTKVSGRYAIASTKLQQLGQNRWVRLRVR